MLRRSPFTASFIAVCSGSKLYTPTKPSAERAKTFRCLTLLCEFNCRLCDAAEVAQTCDRNEKGRSQAPFDV